MINIILSLVIIFGLFFFGLRAVRDMNEKERWSLAKLLTYSTCCAILTLAVLITVVVLF